MSEIGSEGRVYVEDLDCCGFQVCRRTVHDLPTVFGHERVVMDPGTPFERVELHIRLKGSDGSLLPPGEEHAVALTADQLAIAREVARECPNTGNNSGPVRFLPTKPQE